MKVTIRRTDLVEALDLLKEMCPVRFAELGRGVLITATMTSVTLEVTDDSHWGRVRVDRVSTDSEGVLATDPRRLYELVKKMEVPEVELLQDRRGLLVKASESKYTMRLFDLDLHPDFPTFPSTYTHTVEWRGFRQLIDRVAYVAQSDRTLGDTPSGVWLRAKGMKLTLFASSDHIRFVHGSVPLLDSAGDLLLYIHPQSLRRVAALSQLAGADVQIRADGNCVYVQCGCACFRWPVLSGTFSPFYEVLEDIPAPGDCLEVDAPALADAVTRLLLFADISSHSPISLQAQAASCLLTTDTEVGEAEERVGAKRLRGGSFRVRLNGRHLDDVLSKVKAPRFTIGLHGNRLPLLLTPSDHSDLRVWLLPIVD